MMMMVVAVVAHVAVVIEVVEVEEGGLREEEEGSLVAAVVEVSDQERVRGQRQNYRIRRDCLYILSMISFLYPWAINAPASGDVRHFVNMIKGRSICFTNIHRHSCTWKNPHSAYTPLFKKKN